jgi:hypothetical protein
MKSRKPVKAKSKPKAKSRSKLEVRVRGSRTPLFGDQLVMVLRGERFQFERAAKPSESANALVKKVGSALKKPGIPSSAVFPRRNREVFAYSVDPRDPRRIVRQSATGEKTIGRLVDGHFKAN